MITIKLAFRNLMGAGLRTWLIVSVLSFAFVIIVFFNGMLDGWNIQAYNDTKAWEIGSGELWHPTYDPYDPYCIQDAHAPLSPATQKLVAENRITPILIIQGAIYPQQRVQNILLKGVYPNQPLLQLPTASLKSPGEIIPAIIGKRMAASAKLKKGDQVLLRWRDKNGTFDAREIRIVDIFSANVPNIDNGQIWIPLERLRQMTGLQNEATLFVVGEKYAGGDFEQWKFKSQKFLLQEIDKILKTKKTGSSIIYALLLAIALLAIFDTQILSIFRRQKEIGTYIALGMTRATVIQIFTIEGSAHSILAILFGSLYGIPLLGYFETAGIPMPKVVDSAGLSIADKIIPVYSIGLILSTILLVVLSATIVSYFPARKILKMKPTDALKGKIQ